MPGKGSPLCRSTSQNFQDSGRVAQPGFQPFLPSELKTFLDVVRETIPQAQIRGTDLDPRDF